MHQKKSGEKKKIEGWESKGKEKTKQWVGGSEWSKEKY